MAAIGAIVVMAVALSVRGGADVAGRIAATPATSAHVPLADGSGTHRPTPGPTARPTLVPTPDATTATPTLTPGPTSTPVPGPPTAAPVAAAPPPPPAATPTPVPVHDDEPVLITEDRVAGAFGSTLSIGSYQVRATRKTTPSTHECATWPGAVAFEVTIWYGGPLEAVSFDVAGLSSSACYDIGVVGAPWVASGVKADVFVTPSGGASLTGKPLTVYISPDGGSHSLAFKFN